MWDFWKDENARRVILIVLAGLLALAVGARTLAAYRTARLQEIQDSCDMKQMEYEKYAHLLANRDMYVRMQTELGNVEQGIVGKRFLTARTVSLAEVRFQEFLDEVARKNDLAIISRKVLKSTEAGELKELRVSVSSRAEIGALNNFLYAVTAQDVAVFVESLDIKRLGDRDERFYNFNAVLKAYSL